MRMQAGGWVLTLQEEPVIVKSALDTMTVTSSRQPSHSWRSQHLSQHQHQHSTAHATARLHEGAWLRSACLHNVALFL